MSKPERDISIRRLSTASNGSTYASANLSRSALVSAHAFLFREPEIVGLQRLTLKVGRYKIKNGQTDVHDYESLKPKSEVRLTSNEIQLLQKFLEEKVGPVKANAKSFVAIDEEADAEYVGKLLTNLKTKNTVELLTFIEDNNLVISELSAIFEKRQREAALDQFRKMLEDDVHERDWQKWFETNAWVLGSDFVSVLEDRQIDTANISDYLVKALDGHLDIVEIKRPSLSFWAGSRDHDNLIPHTDLVKALVQSQNYIFELEREMNSTKTMERFGGCPIAKPRALLIHGRSAEWGPDEFRAQRLLNGGLSSVQILTYDQVLIKAIRIIATTDTNNR